MTLQKIHTEYLDSDKYWEKKASILIDKIKLDQTGAFWDSEAVFDFMLKEAKLKDSSEKDVGHLGGVSVGVKDLFCISGLKTTAGSKILESFVSPYDSTMWERLKEMGAFMGGKLSMDEFAMGSYTNTSFLGKTSMPQDLSRTAGGSSGGSAAAVASGIVDFSIGSDTGGSVRLPASFCGLVGYKPSYGAFSRFGMIPYASSLDQAGFFTKTLEDLMYVLSDEKIYEKDEKDMTCVGLRGTSEKDVKKIGYFKFILESKDIAEDVKKSYKDLLIKLEKTGVELHELEIPYLEYAAQIYYIIACSEASSNLAKYQGIFYGPKSIDLDISKKTFWEATAEYRSKYFGEEAQRRIMLGSFILSAENFTAMYQKACNLRKVLTHKLELQFETVDMIVLPVAPDVAPKWDEINKMTPAQIYLSDFMTVPFSLAGQPSLSLPLYKDSCGLPIGMQFVGKKLTDISHIKSLDKLMKVLGG